MSVVETTRLQPAQAVLRWLDGIVCARGDLKWLGLTRLLFGAIVIVHLQPALTAETTPLERFHEPWWGWLPIPSETAYRGLVWLGVAAGVAMILGVVSKLATITATSVVTYLLVIDLNAFRHNRAFLVWILFGLALARTDMSWSLRSLWRRIHGRPTQTVGYTWPVTLMRIVVSSVYLTSATTKLIQPDWAGGRVLWDRVNRYQDKIPALFDGAVHDILTDRWFHMLLAPAAIATELFIGLGLWFVRTRPYAIAIAIAFHVSIELTASVQTFSYSAIAALTIWLVDNHPAEERVVSRQHNDMAG